MHLVHSCHRVPALFELRGTEDPEKERQAEYSTGLRMARLPAGGRIDHGQFTNPWAQRPARMKVMSASNIPPGRRLTRMAIVWPFGVRHSLNRESSKRSTRRIVWR